jgi:hypothetical protein
MISRPEPKHECRGPGKACQERRIDGDSLKVAREDPRSTELAGVAGRANDQDAWDAQHQATQVLRDIAAIETSLGISRGADPP